MARLVYTNSRGQSLEMFAPPFHVLKVEGLGDVEANVQTQKSPGQDGSTYIDSLLEERQISVELKIKAKNKEELALKRREFATVFNPKLGMGLLQYIDGTGTKEIEATPDGIPSFPGGAQNVGPNFQNAILFLRATNPYWKSPQITEEPAFEPLFQFPFSEPFEMGVQRDQRIIDNDGDAPAPVYIEFYGPATNPIITNNTTGEFIKVNRILAEGEYMRIDTTPGKKSVEFVGLDGTITNVFNWIDLNSTFFQLFVGQNDIEYTADSDIQGAIVNIRYNKLYNAV